MKRLFFAFIASIHFLGATSETPTSKKIMINMQDPEAFTTPIIFYSYLLTNKKIFLSFNAIILSKVDETLSFNPDEVIEHAKNVLKKFKLFKPPATNSIRCFNFTHQLFYSYVDLNTNTPTPRTIDQFKMPKYSEIAKVYELETQWPRYECIFCYTRSLSERCMIHEEDCPTQFHKACIISKLKEAGVEIALRTTADDEDENYHEITFPGADDFCILSDRKNKELCRCGSSYKFDRKLIKKILDKTTE